MKAATDTLHQSLGPGFRDMSSGGLKSKELTPSTNAGIAYCSTTEQAGLAAMQVENTCLGQEALLSVGERPARLHEANLRVVHQVRHRAHLPGHALGHQMCQNAE